MKKVLFLFAFLLLGIGAMAQKVIYDETNQTDRKSTRLNSSHMPKSRMPSSA